MAKTDDLLEWVAAAPRESDVRWEVQKLHAIKDWALARLGINYKIGDRVSIKAGYEVPQHFADGTAHGWWPYHECLVPGATAIVKDIDFNAVHGYWYADIVLDREFAWNDYLKAHNWHGPIGETPEGMIPPSTYDQEHHSEGRRHTFCFDAEMLERFDS